MVDKFHESVCSCKIKTHETQTTIMHTMLAITLCYQKKLAKICAAKILALLVKYYPSENFNTYVMFPTSCNLYFTYILFSLTLLHPTHRHTQQRVPSLSHPIVVGQQCNSRAFHHWKGPQISDEFHTGVIQTMDAIPCR